jgi:hypothetical protein
MKTTFKFIDYVFVPRAGGIRPLQRLCAARVHGKTGAIRRY